MGSGDQFDPGSTRTADASGFRRLNGYPHAASVSKIAASLDPFRADAVPLECCDYRPEIAFMIAADVPPSAGAEARWNAVVARAYARSDCVAWCIAQGKEDDRLLSDWAERANEALCKLAPDVVEFVGMTEAGTGGRHWIAPGTETGEVMRAWRSRYFDTADGYEVVAEDMVASLNFLRDFAIWARGCASESSKAGRPPSTARDHFVLRLAAAWALINSEVPHLYDGGGKRLADQDRWQNDVSRALKTTGLSRSRKSLNTVLRSAVDKSPDERWSINDLVDFTDRERRLYEISYGGMPAAGIEIDVGCDPKHPPTTRAEAYDHPHLSYMGRSLKGQAL